MYPCLSEFFYQTTVANQGGGIEFFDQKNEMPWRPNKKIKKGGVIWVGKVSH